MVPFQPHPSSLNDKTSAIQETADNLAKKRKWEESFPTTPLNSVFDIELHLETPLPFYWQRCLDIQSGKIHFYNTTTQKRTWKDPRDKLEKDDNHEDDDNDEDNDMSLDLELNLTCESLDKNNNNQAIQGGRQAINNGMIFGSSENYNNNNNNKAEMVAAVCMRCHLLVMMCKSSPECPNCKFMNSPPPEQTSPAMFKRRCHLSW
ncbi:sodium/hydrogen exchanger 1-like [Benincasa hispida]|uniref:sodium/hydrogen exchanger 1-like n=1 Tax=Benincasa hispida TaxID=102211 RepID=UPI0019021FDB|nr:sodium/hydrogen exchanger 1-like [Benincasa hispida]